MNKTGSATEHVGVDKKKPLITAGVTVTAVGEDRAALGKRQRKSEKARGEKQTKTERRVYSRGKLRARAYPFSTRQETYDKNHTHYTTRAVLLLAANGKRRGEKKTGWDRDQLQLLRATAAAVYNQSPTCDNVTDGNEYLRGKGGRGWIDFEGPLLPGAFLLPKNALREKWGLGAIKMVQ